MRYAVLWKFQMLNSKFREVTGIDDDELVMYVVYDHACEDIITTSFWKEAALEKVPKTWTVLDSSDAYVWDQEHMRWKASDNKIYHDL